MIVLLILIIGLSFVIVKIGFVGLTGEAQRVSSSILLEPYFPKEGPLTVDPDSDVIASIRYITNTDKIASFSLFVNGEEQQSPSVRLYKNALGKGRYILDTRIPFTQKDLSIRAVLITSSGMVREYSMQGTVDSSDSNKITFRKIRDRSFASLSLLSKKPQFALETYDSSESGTQASTTCTYTAMMVSLFLFDGTIPGDDVRMQLVAMQNLIRVRDWYQQAFTDLNAQLAALGYSTITNQMVLAISGWDIHHMTPNEDYVLDPVYDPMDPDKIIGTKLNARPSVMLVQTQQNPDAHIVHPDDMELFLIADSIHYDGDVRCGVTSLTEGIINIGVPNFPATPLECLSYTPGYGVLLHEMGHSLGLDHYESTKTAVNLMREQGPPSPFATNLDPPQLMTLLGHLCGQPSNGPNAITFEGQSGRFGVNQYFTPTPYACGNGVISQNEECEKSFFEVGYACVDSYARPVPIWPDTNSVCWNDCECVPFQIEITVKKKYEGSQDTPPPGSSTPGSAPPPSTPCGLSDECRSNSDCDYPKEICNYSTCTCEIACGNEKVEKQLGEECDPPGEICNGFCITSPDGSCSAMYYVYCDDNCACPDTFTPPSPL